MILMIDDDEDALEIYRLLIQKSELASHFRTFHAGQDALRFLDHCSEDNTPGRHSAGRHSAFPRYILLDLNMPGLSGIEFIKTFEKSYPNAQKTTEIIMLTGSVREQDHQQALSYKIVTRFMSKPLSKDTLLSLIRESLED